MARALSLLLLSACVLLTCCSGYKSCKGICGEEYIRGSECQCDFECLSHNECCKNYEAVCTTKGSCKGRCGENFKRGRRCHCDVDCYKFNQCCPDYETHCSTEDYSMEEETSDPEVISPLDDVGTEDFNGYPELYNVPEEPQGSPEPDASSNGLTNSEEPSEEPPTATTASDMHAETTPSVITEPTPTPLKDDPESTATNSNDDSATESSETSPPTVAPEMATTNPTPTVATEPTDQNPEENPQTTAEPKDTMPSDAPFNNPETTNLIATTESTQAVSELQNQTTLNTTPENNDQNTPDGTQAPEDPESQPNPTENPASEVAEVQNTIPTDKPSISQTAGEQNEVKKDPPSKGDIPSGSVPIKNTPASVKATPSPTKAPEMLTKPEVIYNGFDHNSSNYQADANYDTNLCSEKPANGLTTLKNGTIVVFRGHYFWPLDSKRNPGSAQLIKDVWGIPSPIDTVFTRCNCQGKTYFFKGNDYWRFENDNMDPGFPKPISEGFGLKDHITAALSMPKYRSRREAVVFFKPGGLAQKYTYRVTPSCGSKSSAYISKRAKRAEGPELGLEINLQSWKGFPTTVISAVSVPSKQLDGYKYYIFSASKYYSLKMEGEKPVILTPKGGPEKQKPSKSWFRCPEKK